MYFHWRAFMAYPLKILHGLVLDVSSYPSFVPGCSWVALKERQEKQLIATIGTAYGFSFSSFVSWKEKEIHIEGSLSPMVKTFSAQWIFYPLSSTKTEVMFYLQLYKKNLALSYSIKLLAPFILRSFKKKAHSLCAERLLSRIPSTRN